MSRSDCSGRHPFQHVCLKNIFNHNIFEQVIKSNLTPLIDILIIVKALLGPGGLIYFLES